MTKEYAKINQVQKLKDYERQQKEEERMKIEDMFGS